MNDSSIRDPSTANCRIYVGNLKENTQKNDLQNIFSKYGHILGVMISRNFGFIQFENEQSANNAIDNENQKMYNGRKIAVSKAQNKGNQKRPDKQGNNMGGFGAGGGNQNQNQNEPPMQTTPNISMSNTSGSESNMNQPSNNNASNAGNNSNNFGSNNNNNNNNNMGNQRQNWMRNRNNRNNNMNNSSGNSNDMNLNTDRERSPFGRDNTNNDRWNQDGGSGGGGGGSSSNFNTNNTNNYRNNRNNNNMNRNNNNLGGNNFGNTNSNMGNMGNMSNIPNNMGNSGGGPQQPFGNKTDVKNVLNGGVLQGYASAREIRAKYPNANDCEIVVLEKQLLDYAEFIENRLKRGGLTADLLFPNADLSMGKMLSNIVNRGSLYALIISTEHKQNNSVTLNILYGVPSEHRNMPLEDAFALIFRNYQHLRQGENGDIIGDTDDSPYAAIAVANTRHPDSLQHLINLLADNRSLTVLQLDCILSYLKERRESQYKFELGDTSIDVGNPSNAGDSKSESGGVSKMDGADAVAISAEAEAQAQKLNEEEEIQKKLMEILSKPTIPNIKPEPAAVTKTSPEKKHPPSASHIDTNANASNRRHQPNLLTQNPQLRNVLDSLMFDDM